MLAEHNTVVDGQTYKKGQEIPDLGSLVCIDDTKKPIREYIGFVEDKDKLPKYEDLGTGSSATLIDPNGVEKTIIAKYFSSINKWLDMKGGVIV